MITIGTTYFIWLILQKINNAFVASEAAATRAADQKNLKSSEDQVKLNQFSNPTNPYNMLTFSDDINKTQAMAKTETDLPLKDPNSIRGSGDENDTVNK